MSEAFAAVLGALQRGKGPTEGFEGYLVSTVRHEAYRANRRRTKQRPLDDRDDEPAADPFVGREDEEHPARRLRLAPAVRPRRACG